MWGYIYIYINIYMYMYHIFYSGLVSFGAFFLNYEVQFSFSFARVAESFFSFSLQMGSGEEYNVD